MATEKQKFDWYQELTERLPIQPIVDKLSKKTVPIHKHFGWYYLGGICLFLFMVQIVTGILLMLYYQPGEGVSYASVQNINNNIEFGWLFRSIHNWAANIMILAVFIHMFSVFFMRGFKKPREITWLSGILLLALTLVFGFSGYLLPWDELAFFATRVGVKILEAVPFIGVGLADLIRGGSDLSGYTISRFFTLHVVVLPLLFIPLLSLHLIMVNIHPNVVPEDVERAGGSKGSMKFFWEFLFDDIALWIFFLVGLVFLAGVFPVSLGKEADILKPAPEHIHPEWYFMSIFQVLKWLPPSFLGIPGELISMILVGILGTLFLVAPFWPQRFKKHLTIFGVFMVVFFVFSTIYAYIEIM